MTEEESSIALMIPQKEKVLQEGKCPGWSARALYDYLQLSPGAWARWVKKNIVTNPFALEHIDWESLQHDVENRMETRARGRPTQDYVISLDLAKRLAMMARSPKGEEARQYFLECERRAYAMPTLPVFHDPAYQILMQAVIDLDATRHHVAQIEAIQHAHTQALVEQQARTIEALERSQGAEKIAREAVNATGRMTLEDFILGNKLLPQFPGQVDRQGRRSWPVEVTRLKNYCQAYGWAIIPVPVQGKPWPTENEYPIQALAWLCRHPTSVSQLRLAKEPQA